jgi:hypothetical protein
LIAGIDLLLVMEPGVVGLAEGEEMFGEPVAVEAASDDIFGSFDAWILEGGQGEGMALAGENGLKDSLAGNAGEIADDVVELNIHLGERLVEEADLIGGTTEEPIAMAEDGADGTNDFGRAKAGAEKTDGMEILEPLAILDVRFTAGQIFAMAGVDQTDLDPGGFEDLEEGDPVNAGGFHGDGGDATGFEPVAELEQGIGEGLEGTNGVGIGTGGNGDPDFASPDINAGGVGVKGGELDVDFFICLFVARSHKLPLVQW